MPNLSKPQKHNKLERRQKGVQKARRVLRAIRPPHTIDDEFYGEGGRYEHMLTETRKPCSCYMCSNRRKHDGPTKQELLSVVDLKDQIEEIENPPI